MPEADSKSADDIAGVTRTRPDASAPKDDRGAGPAAPVSGDRRLILRRSGDEAWSVAWASRSPGAPSDSDNDPVGMPLREAGPLLGLDPAQTARLLRELEAARRQDAPRGYANTPSPDAPGLEVLLDPLQDPPDSLLCSLRPVPPRSRLAREIAEQRRQLACLQTNLFGLCYRCLNDEHWTMLELSEGFRELTGYAPESVIGNRDRSWETLIHPEDRTPVRIEFEKSLAEGRRFEGKYRIITADGGLRWVKERALPVALGDDNPAIIEGVIVDVTEFKRAELALEERERLLRAILDHSFQFTGLLDTEGRLIRANQSALDAIKVAHETVAGRFFWETPWWTHLPAEQARLKSAVDRARRGEFVRFETTHPAPGGGILHVDFSLKPVRDEHGEVVLLIPEGRDITAHKVAEDALRESEEKFSKAFLASPYSLTISDLETGRYLDINAGFERVSGYTREEVIGHTSLELDIWENPADRHEILRRLRETGRVRDMEIHFRAKHRRLVITLCNIERIDLAGRPCLLSAIEDITARRHVEREKALLEAQLRQNQKLEALGTLAGGIAHDFNNILTAIVANQELALFDLDDPGHVRERLGEIAKASSRAKELVRQILAFSRQQPLHRKRQSLPPLVEEALGLVRASLPASITIERSLAADTPPVRVDATQIHQIVMNLCANAAHAMRNGPGRLSIRLGRADLKPADADRFPGLAPGPYARLSVGDDGHGMDEAVLARVFEPFFTTKGPGEGTGLGLAVVHGIMKDYDGGIFVRSRPGEGAEFDLFFPAALEPPAATAEATGRMIPGQGESILLVDDEPAICDAVSSLLRKIGYRVEKFVDPLVALERFARNPEGFDLLLTDRTMPRLAGPALITRVRDLRPGLPAVLMSGNSAAETPARCEVVEKPPAAESLSLAVHRALASARASAK